MASVYTNDLRLEEIGSGEQSGTWGDTTNTNLELIAEAFSFGTEAITTNADTHTTTIADGATDPGRSMFLKYTGTLDSACTITIAPNTVSKLWFIENGTSGSQNIIISQGSGANITIPPGDTKAIYSDGAGSSAAMVDAFASLSVVDLKVQDDLTVTDDAAIGGLATVGGTLGVTGIATFTDDIIIGDGKTIGSASTVGAITIASDGDITLSADLNVGANFDVTGNAVIDGTALVTGVLTTTAATVFNGGFAAVQESTVIVADGQADNAYAFQIKNEEATDDRSFGLLIHAGSTATDRGLTINTHDGGKALFYVQGNGQALHTVASQGSAFVPNTSTTWNALEIFQDRGVTNSASGIAFRSQSGTAPAGIVSVAGNTTGGIESLAFMTSTGNATIERMRIKDTGLVGIGTDDPSAGLTVQAADGNVGGTIMITSTGVASAGMACDANGLNFGADTGGFVFKTGGSANDPTDSGTSKMQLTSGGVLEVGEIQEQTQGTDISVTMVSEDAGLALTSRSATDAHSGYISFVKTPATSGNYTATASGDRLGVINFVGVNTAGGADNGGQILVQQTGTASGTVPAEMQFFTNEAQRMTILSSGTVLVSKTASDGAVQGHEFRTNDFAIHTVDNGPALYARRIGSGSNDNGDTQIFQNTDGTFGVIGNRAGLLSIGSGDVGIEFHPNDNAIYPMNMSNYTLRDNAINLGSSDYRFSTAFITNGVTTGSDRNEKQDIAKLTATEMLVAARLSKTFHTYRWKDSFVEKGEDARIHTGTIAQELQAAFTAEGLDAGRYGMFMSDTWWGYDVEVPAVEADDTVDPAIEAKDAYTRNDHYKTEDEAPSGSIKKTRLGIRYPELLSFLAAYNEQRFAAIETRLTALEG